MASTKKFTHAAMCDQNGHVDREHDQPSNTDIQVSIESIKKYYNKYKTNDGMGKLLSKEHKNVYTIIL